MHTRPYRDLNDLNGMMGLLSRGHRSPKGRHYIHPGDLSWWLFYLEGGEPVADQITIWEDAGQVRAWVLYAPRLSTFDLFADADISASVYADLHAQCEAEATDKIRAAGGTMIHIGFVAETDLARQRLLRERGYALNNEKPGYVAFSQPLDAPSDPPALTGVAVVRPVAGEHELEPRARAQYAAFNNTMPWDDYLARYRRLMHAPVYRPEHDMGLVLADGRFAAVCLYWTDAASRIGHFEPVGTHPDFQRRGYGRALLRTVMDRMQAEGMTIATVNTGADDTGNIAFYQRCGFGIRHRVLEYTKQLGG